MQELLKNKLQSFNQLNSNKNISNYFIPKKNISKKFTKNSFQIRIWENYISVPKRFCFLDKNKQNYLIGINPNYIYNCYDAKKNWREKIVGYKLIEKYNLKGYHFLTVEKQRFANMQKTNPFFMQFKNVQESMEWHRKQVFKERKELKMFLINHEKNKNIEIPNINIINEEIVLDIINKTNIDYEQKLYQTTKKMKKKLNLNKLLNSLNDLIFC